MRETHELIAARIGARLKELRAGRTQAQFAAELGLSQAQYNRYETGKRLAPDRVLTEAARVCGVTPGLVIGDEIAPAGGGELAGQLSNLVGMLSAEDRQDLYFFLKNKVEQAAKRQSSQAREALEYLRDKVV